MSWLLSIIALIVAITLIVMVVKGALFIGWAVGGVIGVILIALLILEVLSLEWIIGIIAVIILINLIIEFVQNDDHVG